MAPFRRTLAPDGGATAEEEALARWSEGRLDVSHPAEWLRAPKAIEAIAAQRFGWEAVRGPGPLTFEELQLSLQLAAEERVGWLVRETARQARAEQDAAFAALAQQVGDDGAG